MNLFQQLSLYLLTTAAIMTLPVKETWGIATSRNLPIHPLELPRQIAQASDADTRKTKADRLLLQGIEEYGSNLGEQALQSWQRALEIYRQIKDSLGEEDALGNIGIVYYSSYK